MEVCNSIRASAGGCRTHPVMFGVRDRTRCWLKGPSLTTDVPSPCTLLVHPTRFGGGGSHLRDPKPAATDGHKALFPAFLTGLKISFYYPKNTSRDSQGDDFPDISFRLIIMSLWKYNPENNVPLSALPITGGCIPSPRSPMSLQVEVPTKGICSTTPCFPWGLFSWQS